MEVLQAVPTLILFPLRGVPILFTIEPKLEPVHISLINFITMFGLDFGMKLMCINKHFYRFTKLLQGGLKMKRNHEIVFCSI
jgi:hypothetical protein